MMPCLRLSIAACVALSVVPGVHAAVCELQNAGIDTTGYPRMAIRFEVMSEHSELVSSLNVEDVTVLEKDQPVKGELRKIGLVNGIGFVFAVDVSGSMKEVMPEVRTALVDFVGRLEDGDRCALVAFHDDQQQLIDFAVDRSALVAAMREMETPGKRTELFYGVVRGLELLQQEGLPERKVLVLISDGKNEGGAYTLESCREMAAKVGASIMGIGIKSGSQTDWRNVQRLSTETGGVFLPFESGQRWKDKLAAMRTNLESRWEFVWTSSLPADGSEHAAVLEVKMPTTQVRRSFSFRVPLHAIPPQKTPWLLYVGIALVGVAACSALLWFRSRARHLAYQGEMHRVEEEKRQQADAFQKLEGQLAQATASIKEMEQRVVQSGSDARPAAPPAARPKQRTMYDPGTSVLQAYRAGSLHVESGPLAGSNLPLLPARTSLGRALDNNIVLDEERVSSHHAVIEFRDHQFWLEDLQSTNGTYLAGGERIDQPTLLTSGQRFRIGGVVLQFRGEV